MAANINPDDFLNSIILEACSPGKYLGKEAPTRLNNIAKSVHYTILRLCKEYSEIDLLTNFYDMFDEACYHILSGEYWLTDDVSLIRRFEMAPSVFSYLINAVLYSRSDSPNPVKRSEMDLIVSLASFLIETCNYSDFLFYSNIDDGFEISDTGELNVIQSNRTKILQKRAMQKVGTRRLTVRSKELWGETKSFKELSAPYDSAFKQKYGIKFSDVSEIISHGVLHNMKRLSGTIRSSYRELLKRFKKGLNLPGSTVRSAIKLFELDREMLLSDWRYHRLYDMRPSSSRQPVVHILGRVCEEGVVLYGPNALLRALTLLFADLDRGIVDLGAFSDRWLTRKGLAFEQKVKNLFVKHGFKVLHLYDTPDNVGDIDCIAYNDTLGTLFVIEAKSPKIDLSAREIRWQIKKSQEWYQQLLKKSSWVKANLNVVAKLLGITTDRIQRVRDIVVVEVPAFSDESTASRIITIEDLYYMLEGMNV